MRDFNVLDLWYAIRAPGRGATPSAARRRVSRAIGAGLLLLLLAGCGAGVTYPDYSNTPSPLYGGRPCPGSATSRSGGVATPWDCTVLRDN